MSIDPKSVVLLCLLLGVASDCGEEVASTRQEKPNILLIFVDDLGYADLGVQGSTDILTPHIDRLAREGVRFTNGYVTAPQCSPARAGILTGRIQNRFGLEMNWKEGRTDLGLPVDEITIADRLKSEGYSTGIVGKWHLGLAPKFHPQNRGFDESYVLLKGGGPYLPNKGGPILERNHEPERLKEYITDAFTSEAIKFIEGHSDDPEEPFFLYLSYTCPHTPLEPKPEYLDLDHIEGIATPHRKKLAAMMWSLDEGVGRIMKTLKDEGVDENTLVFFISDNGGQTDKNASLNDPFFGAKGDLFEGGIRIPYIARWTGRIPAEATLDAPVSSLDVCATAVKLAGIPAAPELEGLDLMPYLLSGEAQELEQRTLYWRFAEQRAIRRGDWKYYSHTPEITLLFNLSVDPEERFNLCSEHPELVREFRDLYAYWEKEMPEPIFQAPVNKKKLKNKLDELKRIYAPCK